MRELDVSVITDAVRRLCIKANTELSPDVEARLRQARDEEPWPAAQAMLSDLVQNLDVARREHVAICQDTGIATVFLEIGQDVHLVGGDLTEAVNRGVAAGYTEGYLRKSLVRDPLRRVNTNDNTPATLHMRIVPGEAVRITVAPKGAGSENMCTVKMLVPAEGIEGVRRFVVDWVTGAGGRPCPPTVVGVGIGGGFDSVAQLAKEALLRPLDEPNPDPFYDQLEHEMLDEINQSGVGPQGIGGRTTALAVLIKAAPTHIAMLPVAVCVNCHFARHASEVL